MVLKGRLQELMSLGLMYLITSEDGAAGRYLLAGTNPVTLGNRFSFLKFYSTGAIQLATSNKFLNFNEDGILVIGDWPDTRFKMEKESWPCGRNILYYDGYSDFQLCANGSIGFESTCADSQLVKIAFIEKW